MERSCGIGVWEPSSVDAKMHHQCFALWMAMTHLGRELQRQERKGKGRGLQHSFAKAAAFFCNIQFGRDGGSSRVEDVLLLSVTILMLLIWLKTVEVAEAPYITCTCSLFISGAGKCYSVED